MTKVYDIFIIGGGINGCGIARDAAGRGYAVYLAEMNDLASGTSSWSTKIIHGGLRYLEHYEFRLVREALIEREILWSIAPHIIKPMRFILPYHKGLRPSWLLRLGLLLYDHLGGRKLLPATKILDLKKDEAGQPIKKDFTKAFEYSDCQVDDSRLVILNAVDAADHGAMIKPRTRVISAMRDNNHWIIKTKHTLNGKEETVHAKYLINAAGPWADHVLHDALDQKQPKNLRLVQGSHIVINKKFDHNRAYIFQNADDRICFAIPYKRDFTLIGTTDRDYDDDPADCIITDQEIDYLCNQASTYFHEAITRNDIVWTFAGVRSLYDDGKSKAQETTRDYVLDANEEQNLINVFGGKLTTYRKLAEAVIKHISPSLRARGEAIQNLDRRVTNTPYDDGWTKDAPLPGGDFPVNGFEKLHKDIKTDYPFLNDTQAKRMGRLYGTLTFDILGDAKTLNDLGRDFGHGLYEREVRYLTENEWAVKVNDILWRRTKTRHSL